MFYYRSHLGGFYTSEEDYDIDYLYCDQCGDFDELVGEFLTPFEFLAEISNEIELEPGEGGYDLKEVLREIDYTGSYEDALQAVIKNHVYSREYYED